MDFFVVFRIPAKVKTIGGLFKIKGSTDLKKNGPGLTFLSILGSVLGTLGSILRAGGEFLDEKR